MRGILKGVGRESVMLQWIQIYGTWFLQVCSHGLVGEVGALITIYSTSYTAFFIPNSSPKLKKAVTVILASVAYF